MISQFLQVSDWHRLARVSNELARYGWAHACHQLHDTASYVGLESNSPGEHDPGEVDVPVLFVDLPHLHQHGLPASFDGSMGSFEDSIGSLVEVGNKDDFDVEGLLKILPESCHKGISVI